MIVQLASGPESDVEWIFRISLTGPWVGLDELLAQSDPEALREYARLGIPVAIPEISGASVLYAGTMIDPAQDTDAPPLIASVTILEGPGAPELPAPMGGEVEPIRRVDTSIVTWPDGSGEVQLLRVRYAMATPSPTTSLVVMFTTPNTPVAESMEIFFDALMASASFGSANDPA